MVEPSRIVGAILHLSIPWIVYQVMYNDFASDRISKWISKDVQKLDDNRKLLYMVLDVFYSVRWAIGMLIMQGRLTVPSAIFVAAKHLLADELGYVVASMISVNRSGPLGPRDYACAAIMIVAGILQHGSEIQRYWFKSNPNNTGKIYTGGLFKLARGINHTGHVLRDIGHMILAPSWPLLVLYLMADYDLVCQIFPETQGHMRIKYGEQWDKFENSTPWIYVPFIY